MKSFLPAFCFFVLSFPDICRCYKKNINLFVIFTSYGYVFLGNAERQVLVEDYDIGKGVAFDSRNSNLKEVYTLDGYKMLATISFVVYYMDYEHFFIGASLFVIFGHLV